MSPVNSISKMFLQLVAVLALSCAALLTSFIPAYSTGSDQLNISNDHGEPNGDDETHTAARPSLPETAAPSFLPKHFREPQAPFTAPLVGPIIKRAFSDDIDRRTTAFLPSSLSNLTPIDVPVGEPRWIRVDLSEQKVIAYEADKPVRGFIISSGLPRTPTVTGEYRIGTKVRSQTMSGGSGADYYLLPNVQWVQYFHQGYAFHGTYWHNDFGQPKSHGCLNMTNADAKWLFDWAGPVWDGHTTWFSSTASNPGALVIITE